ncbi:hypothetical protein JTB14_020288 [Gonioctena quinquepunctata]|nr:hypothetical protein JTB14_020288 [Gonioctena quinquepunctata]
MGGLLDSLRKKRVGKERTDKVTKYGSKNVWKTLSSLATPPSSRHVLLEFDTERRSFPVHFVNNLNRSDGRCALCLPLTLSVSGMLSFLCEPEDYTTKRIFLFGTVQDIKSWKNSAHRVDKMQREEFSQEAGHHRARVADSSRSANATAKPSDQQSTHQTSAANNNTTTNAIVVPTTQQQNNHQQQQQPSNFEYDDNEWDIGIGDLIIDLDADIEKTNDVIVPTATSTNQAPGGGMAANAGQGGPQQSKAQATAKMHIEHSATADKGLKMKIKRTKPGTKTSEAKHEIVKSNEQNGGLGADQADVAKGGTAQHPEGNT